MSRFYGMSVRISNHDPARVAAIIEAAEEEWPFGGLTDNGTSLSGYGEDNLIAGCSEKDFAEQFTAAIWRANGAIATWRSLPPIWRTCHARPTAWKRRITPG